MSIKIIKEVYRKMVSESPEYDRNIQHDTISPEMSLYKITTLHPTARNLGDEHYHVDIGDGDHYFYHKNENGKIDSFSKVSDGVHEFVNKENGVHSDIVRKNFEHALSSLGSIMSDNKQSKGAMLFWQNIHEKFPGKKVVAVNQNNTEIEIKNHEHMKEMASKLWGKDGTNFRIKIYD